MGDGGDGGHGGEGDEGGGAGGDEEEGNLAALVVRDGAHALRRLLRFLFLSLFGFTTNAEKVFFVKEGYKAGSQKKLITEKGQLKR